MCQKCPQGEQYDPADMVWAGVAHLEKTHPGDTRLEYLEAVYLGMQRMRHDPARYLNQNARAMMIARHWDESLEFCAQEIWAEKMKQSGQVN